MKIFSPDSVIEIGKTVADVSGHTDISVVPSPEGGVIHSGTKCEHGVYIPYTHPDPDRAPYCSLCYPYLLKLKSGD